MSDSSASAYDAFTLNDLHLADLYYPILIDLAKHKHCLTYAELIARAREDNPDDKYVKNAIPVSTGRKLEVIRHYTKDNHLPNLTSLIISKTSGQCGDSFVGDPDSTRRMVYEKDWTNVPTKFNWFISETRKKITPRKTRKEPEAREMMAAYYKLHKGTLPASIREKRELIIELLMEGFSVEEAYAEAINTDYET